jgi:hypothetical protein
VSGPEASVAAPKLGGRRTDAGYGVR